MIFGPLTQPLNEKKILKKTYFWFLNRTSKLNFIHGVGYLQSTCFFATPLARTGRKRDQVIFLTRPRKAPLPKTDKQNQIYMM